MPPRCRRRGHAFQAHGRIKAAVNSVASTPTMQQVPMLISPVFPDIASDPNPKPVPEPIKTESLGHNIRSGPAKPTGSGSKGKTSTTTKSVSARQAPVPTGLVTVTPYVPGWVTIALLVSEPVDH